MKKHLLKLLLLCCIGILALSMFACVPSTEQYKLDFIVEGEVYDSRTTDGYSRINPPKDPVREGYTFAGWYFDEEYTVEYHSYSLEKNPISQDTRVYAKWEKGDWTHDCEPGSWVVEVKATCKEEGVQARYCTKEYCKKKLETQSIPVSTQHAATKTVIKDKVPSTCVEKGSYVEATYCTLCGKVLKETSKSYDDIDKNAHTYENGVLTKVGDKFNFSAGCKDCGTTISLQNVVVTEEILEAPTCTSAGEVRYRYSAFGGAVSESEVIPAVGHVVAGVAIEYTTVYSEKTHKDVLAKVDLFANDKSCGEVVEGLFLCETCNTYCNIKVNKPHTGIWKETKAPTCHAVGVETLVSCSACSSTGDTRDVAPTGDHQNGVLSLRKDGDRFDLVVPCVNAKDGCDYATVVLSDVPVTTEEIISNSCFSPDVIRYTFKDKDTLVTLDVVTRSGHFLDGVRASTLQDAEGWFDYRLVTPVSEQGGIKLFDGRVLNCDEGHNGYYDCSSCGEKVLVEIYRPHSGSWITSIPATCTSEGVSNFYCDFCDYGDDGLVTKPIPVEPHVYTWELTIVKVEGVPIAPFALVGTCICGDKTQFDNVLVTTNVSRQPTCYEEGEIIYTHVYEGKEYYATEKIPMIDHSINGVIVNTSGKFDYATYVVPGKIVISHGQTVVCGSETPVEGYFFCSECEKFIFVDVYRTHSGETVEIIDPASTSCVKTGTRYLDCIYEGCEGTEPVSFTEVNHKYAVKVTSSGTTHNVEVFCEALGCGYVEKYTGVASVDVKIIVAATCCTEGIVEYKFTHNGTAYNFTTNVGKGNHYFHGVDYTTLLDGDDCISSDLEGLRIFGSDTAAFKCEVCDQLVQVKLKSDEE